MRVLSSVPPGYERGVIWEGPDGQQVLGPRVIELELVEPAEDLSPFPLHVVAALVDRRYEVTRLVLRADAAADDPMDVVRHDPDRIARGTRSDHLPAVTARGLAAVKLPAILREGLYGKCWSRFRNTFGEWVEGVSKGDEVPVTYLLARALGEDPTKAVADALGLTRAVAAQRVLRARRADPPQLPPADRKGGR